jgi:DNA gyrase/topoisomerase IV subunit B
MEMQALTAVECVRVRPGMYLGSVGAMGAEHMLLAVVLGRRASLLERGLVGVVHAALLRPHFDGPTLGRLDTPEATSAVAAAVASALPAYLAQYPQVRRMLAARVTA